MTLRVLTAACAALCLVSSSIAFANVAPPEPEQPAAAAPAGDPAAAPPAEGTAPAEAPAADPAAAPTDPAAEAAPAEATPTTETTEAAPEVAADAAPAEGGGTPWLWIAIGAAVVGGLGFFLWRRNAA